MINNSITYTIAAGGLTQAITLTDLYDEYFFRSGLAVALAGNVSITPSGTPTTDLIIIRTNWHLTLNGSTVTVFGTSLTQEMCLNDLRIESMFS